MLSSTQDKDRVNFRPHTQGITSGVIGLTLLGNFNCNGDCAVGMQLYRLSDFFATNYTP